MKIIFKQKQINAYWKETVMWTISKSNKKDNKIKGTAKVIKIKCLYSIFPKRYNYISNNIRIIGSYG